MIIDWDDGEWVWAREAAVSMNMQPWLQASDSTSFTAEPDRMEQGENEEEEDQGADEEMNDIAFTIDDVIGIAADMEKGILYFSSQRNDKGKSDEIGPDGEKMDRWHEVFRL